MKKWTMLAIAAACAVTLSGCNTFAGAGKDIERGGEKIQDASQRVKMNWREWREARERTDGDYEMARKNCGGMPEDQREACRERGRVAYNTRMNEARGAYRRNEMRFETEEERREEAYEMARNKCDAMRGAAEDRCVADARAMMRR